MITTHIQLRFNDIDIQGHLYNGQYQHLFDLGKSAYFSQVMGLSDMSGEDALITANTNANFYIPVGIDDDVVINTSVERIGNKSITVFQQMVDFSSCAVKADCHTTLVAYNAKTKQTYPIPDLWRERIVNHEGIEL